MTTPEAKDALFGATKELIDTINKNGTVFPISFSKPFQDRHNASVFSILMDVEISFYTDEIEQYKRGVYALVQDRMVFGLEKLLDAIKGEDGGGQTQTCKRDSKNQ